MATSDCDADDWNKVSTEQKFDLFKKDGSRDLSNDVDVKHDDRNCDDTYGDNTLCNISMIDVESFMFLLLII